MAFRYSWFHKHNILLVDCYTTHSYVTVMLLQVGANNMCISPTRVVTIFIHNTIIVAKNIYYNRIFLISVDSRIMLLVKFTTNSLLFVFLAN